MLSVAPDDEDEHGLGHLVVAAAERVTVRSADGNSMGADEGASRSGCIGG